MININIAMNIVLIVKNDAYSFYILQVFSFYPASRCTGGCCVATICLFDLYSFIAIAESVMKTRLNTKCCVQLICSKTPPQLHGRWGEKRIIYPMNTVNETSIPKEAYNPNNRVVRINRSAQTIPSNKGKATEMKPAAYCIKGICASTP